MNQTKTKYKFEDFHDCCNQCGNQHYKIIRYPKITTAIIGQCPICKTKTGIIPAKQWAYMTGTTEQEE